MGVWVCVWEERERRWIENHAHDNAPSHHTQTGREKRALKFTKRKLGTHKRGKAKRDEVADILRKKK